MHATCYPLRTVCSVTKALSPVQLPSRGRFCYCKKVATQTFVTEVGDRVCVVLLHMVDLAQMRLTKATRNYRLNEE